MNVDELDVCLVLTKDFKRKERKKERKKKKRKEKKDYKNKDKSGSGERKGKVNKKHCEK